MHIVSLSVEQEQLQTSAPMGDGQEQEQQHLTSTNVAESNVVASIDSPMNLDPTQGET